MNTGEPQDEAQGVPTGAAAVEAYPGQSDEIPLFKPRVRESSGIPHWLRVARPEWYRTDVGPVLHVSGKRDLVVRSVADGWTVAFDGHETPAPTFEALLDALEAIGARLGPTLSTVVGEGQPTVITGLELGFAADLMWWCPDEVHPSINGILFDDWFEAPATYLDIFNQQAVAVWEHIDELHWELEEGYSMTGMYGTIYLWRIGARYVGEDDGDYEVGAYTGPEVAIDYFRSRTSQDDWDRYGIGYESPS